jgi:hypothetical protein
LSPTDAAYVAIGDPWGWDTESQICWTRITGAGGRTAWQVSAYDAWTLLSVVVATLSTLVVVVHLVRFARLVNRRLASSLVLTVSSSPMSTRVVYYISWRVVLYPLILILARSIPAATDLSITASRGIESGRLPFPILPHRATDNLNRRDTCLLRLHY